MTSKLAIALAVLLFALAGARAQAPASLQPLGISLEEYAYPHPVAFLDVTVDGKLQKLAYMDVPPTGTANGRAVLLMHGRNFPAAYWAPTITALTTAGYRVVAPDQIHFGKSSKPDDAPVSFDMMAAHMDQLLTALNLPVVSLVAHSMGNMAAVRFVRSHPARVDRMVMYGPVGLEDYRRYVPPVAPDRCCHINST